MGTEMRSARSRHCGASLRVPSSAVAIFIPPPFALRTSSYTTLSPFPKCPSRGKLAFHRSGNIDEVPEDEAREIVAGRPVVTLHQLQIVPAYHLDLSQRRRQGAHRLRPEQTGHLARRPAHSVDHAVPVRRHGRIAAVVVALAELERNLVHAPRQPPRPA